MKANVPSYLKSLADEIHSQSTRIRDLIGDKHWLTDGHQKEYLLRESLLRHSPAGTLVSRGFVINPADSESCSTEQDLLIVDAFVEAPIFNQGGVLVVFPRSILAAVSVKTRLTKETVLDSVNGLQTVREVARAAGTDPNQVWCGAFFFEEPTIGNRELIYQYIEGAVKGLQVTTPLFGSDLRIPVGPNVFATSKNTFFRLRHGVCQGQETTVKHSLNGYDCGGLATFEFLADLLDHVASRRGLTESQFLGFSDCHTMTPLRSGALEIVHSVA